MTSNTKNLTQHEIPRLPETFNLTDGHIHRRWDDNELKIIERTGDIFKNIDREKLPEIEVEYLETFYKLARQTWSEDSERYLLCTSASMSLEIVANYLRLNNLGLALIEPCFDNLADIFKRHNTKLESFDEKYLFDESVGDFLRTLKSDVICLVTPNNPTGTLLLQENLEKIAHHCKESNKILILDTSFRFYTPSEEIFDQYKVLDEIGVSYIFIEDTGKTWPTHDMKISILAMSKDLREPLYDIYTDFILHVSPFTIKLLSEFLKNSISDNLHKVCSVARRNHHLLKSTTEGTILTPVQKPFSSVAWVEIKNGLSALELKEILDKNGIFVLPGDYFFWSDRKKGSKFVRIALTREHDKFKRAMEKLREVLKEIT